MATAHRSPENVLVGKRTRGVSTLALRVGCVVRAQRAVLLCLLVCYKPLANLFESAFSLRGALDAPRNN